MKTFFLTTVFAKFFVVIELSDKFNLAAETKTFTLFRCCSFCRCKDKMRQDT